MGNLRKEASGRECQVREPGVCNFDETTVVLAHLNGAGMGMKHHDVHGCWACDQCHSWLDGRAHTGLHSKEYRELAHLQAMVRTQQILIREGKIKT